MNSKKRLLGKSRLYIILDKKTLRYSSVLNIAEKIKDLNPDVIQLRDKESKKELILKDAFLLKKLLAKKKTIFIINDYIDIAKIVDSDGIHLGQNDLPPAIARKLLGRDKIIGISCHNLRQTLKAQEQGADYISVGPVFPTSTKPEYREVGLDLLKIVAKNIRIPFFAIGGINEDNINGVLSSGARRVAISKAVCQAKNILSSIKNFRKN